VRFVFCKTDDILAEAAARLARLKAGMAPAGRDDDASVRSGLQR
jgi:hypothetical protein